MRSDAYVGVDRVLRDVKIRVKVIGIRRFRIRAWVATRIIRFGVWVLGCQCEVTHA
jgi:hypothetical protein